MANLKLWFFIALISLLVCITCITYIVIGYKDLYQGYTKAIQDRANLQYRCYELAKDRQDVRRILKNDTTNLSGYY